MKDSFEILNIFFRHFNLKRHLTGPAHVKSDRQKFKCGECDQVFLARDKRDRHEVLHLSRLLGVKPYGCKICGHRVNRVWRVRDHIKKKHKDIKDPRDFTRVSF